MILEAKNSLFTNLHGLENWDTANVTTMGAMFTFEHSLRDISAIGSWDVSNVLNYSTPEGQIGGQTTIGMFSNCNSLADASAIKDWDINKNANFAYMFKNTPTHPEFTKLAGIWNAEGTFIPN